jgi:hypothetical protein
MNATDIIWENAHPPASEEMIATVERVLGVRFPEDFRSIIPTAHGGSPAPVSRFRYADPDLGHVGTSLGAVMSFDAASSDYILKRHAILAGEGIIPALVVPFGEDGGGDFMAFDFRGHAADPPVVYVSHESATEANEGENVYPLAPSFTAFLEMLELS